MFIHKHICMYVLILQLNIPVIQRSLLLLSPATPEPYNPEISHPSTLDPYIQCYRPKRQTDLAKGAERSGFLPTLKPKPQTLVES